MPRTFRDAPQLRRIRRACRLPDLPRAARAPLALPVHGYDLIVRGRRSICRRRRRGLLRLRRRQLRRLRALTKDAKNEDAKTRGRGDCKPSQSPRLRVSLAFPATSVTSTVSALSELASFLTCWYNCSANSDAAKTERHIALSVNPASWIIRKPVSPMVSAATIVDLST
jgi:hypothetical protein